MNSTILDWIRERFDLTDRVNRKRRDTSIDVPDPLFAKRPRISDDFSDTEMDFSQAKAHLDTSRRYSKHTGSSRFLNDVSRYNFRHAQEEDGNNQAAYTNGHASRKELNLSRIDSSSAAFGNPAASSTMRKYMPMNASMMARPSIPDLLPIRTSQFNGTSSSQQPKVQQTPLFSMRTHSSNMVAPSQPARGSSSLYTSALFKQSNAVPLLKQPPQRQQHSFRSGIGHRGSKMLQAALETKRAPSLMNNMSSIFGAKYDENERLGYMDLLRKLVPSLYSKRGRKSSIRRTDAVDLTRDESNTILDLTGDETPTADGSKTPKEEDDVVVVEPVNTLLERLSCRPQFNKDLVDQVAGQYSTSKESRKVEIRAIQDELHARRRLTSEQRSAFNKQLSDSIVLETVILDEDEADEEAVPYPQLKDDEANVIKRALFGGSGQEVIINKFNLSITRADLNTLVGTTWLNDEVINFYMNLIMQRSEERPELPRTYCMNTFFIPKLMTAGHAGLRRWTRKVDIFSYDLIPLPVHVGQIHWCMAVIRVKDKIIRYYDSMGNPNKPVLDALEQYLRDEAMDKKKIKLDTSDWKKESVTDCPRQMNGSDCGVFSCMFAEHISRNARLSFGQAEMPYFRQKMVLEIAKGKLLM